MRAYRTLKRLHLEALCARRYGEAAELRRMMLAMIVRPEMYRHAACN